MSRDWRSGTLSFLVAAYRCKYVHILCFADDMVLFRFVIVMSGGEMECELDLWVGVGPAVIDTSVFYFSIYAPACRFKLWIVTEKYHCSVQD